MAAIDGKWLSKEGLTYFWSKIKAIFTKQTETNAIANLGAKNLLKVTSAMQTINGVTFTVNDDQTVTVNGTASATTTYVITSNSQAILIPDGNYILSGCPNGGGDATYDLRWYLYSTGKSAYDQGSGVTVAKNGNTTSSNIAIVIRSGVTANNLVFKPMLRLAEITDDSFQPYAKTNRELTVVGDEDRAALIDQVDGGAKNLVNLNTSFTTHTHKGITYTNNGDGTINVAGTSIAADSYATLYDRNENNLFGVPIGETVVIKSTSNAVSINLIYKKQGGGYGLTVRGYKDTPATFTVPTDFVGFLLRISVPNNGTTVNENVGAILCTATDYAISPEYVPYAPTNRELYETRFASKTILPNNVDLNDIKTGGIYNGVNSTGNSAVHMPVATGSFNFVLTVIEANEFIIQIFKQLNSAGDPNLYIRRFYIYNSDWDSWYQFTGTQV